jgi:hypothetical protein
MKRFFLIKLFFIFVFIVQAVNGKINAQINQNYSLSNGQIRTDIAERCIANLIGFRNYLVNATYSPETQNLTISIETTGIGSVIGTNRNANYVTEFRILNSRGDNLATIATDAPNNIPSIKSFVVRLNENPYRIKALKYQILTQTFCNGVNQDSHEFFYEEDVTNGTFQIPCPVVNKFEVTPNPVQPGGEVTIEWDVSNLFQSRYIKFAGQNVPPDKEIQYTPTGTLTFQAPDTPGNYDYTLDVFDVNNSHVDGCSFPVKRPLVVSGGRYFWLVKRINPLAPTIPYLSPFEYYSETLASPHPPGSNPTGSFVRIPETGSFEAGTPESAQTLSPFYEDAEDKLRQMKEADERRYPQIGLVTPDKNRAMAEYRNAFESYQQALNSFRNAQPKPGAGQIGPSNLVLVRKTNEEVSPYDK